MLTREQYNQVVDAHVQAAQEIVRTGNLKGAAKMLSSLVSLCWEITRPEVSWHEVWCDDQIPPHLRDRVARLKVNIIADGDNEAIMAWGSGMNHDGNNTLDRGDMSQADTEAMYAVIDRMIDEKFSYIKKSKITTFDEFRRTPQFKKYSEVKHVEVTKDQIDEAAAKFSAEIDSIFETWGGGDNSG